jgi:ATP-dependent DNA ligase
MLTVPAKFIRPCIPSTAKTIPKGDTWLHEPKLDGYSFRFVKDDRAVRFYSRRGNEWTKWLPNFAAAFQGVRKGISRCANASLGVIVFRL